MSSVSPSTPNMTACQAIVFYHTCGCKSAKNPVYFCTKPDCQHEASHLVVAGLPFACGSQQGQSEECKIEDKAKKEFVREVDTADKLEKIVVLPECTKEDINELRSSWTGPLTPEGDFCSHYQRRHGVEPDDSPSQEATPSSPDIKVEEVDLEEDKQGLQEHSEVSDEAHRSDEHVKVGSDVENEQEEDNDICKDDDTEVELFVVGDEENVNEFVDVELDDDYDIYEDVDINKNLESYGEHANKAHEMEIEDHPYIGEEEASRNAFSPVQDRFDETVITDDIIDIMIDARENEANEPEGRKTTLGMIWSCFQFI